MAGSRYARSPVPLGGPLAHRVETAHGASAEHGLPCVQLVVVGATSSGVVVLTPPQARRLRNDIDAHLLQLAKEASNGQ